VKIGSPEDFIGAVSEHVLTRGKLSSRQGGSILGSRFLTRQITQEDEPSSPSTDQPRSLTSPVASPTTDNQPSIAANANFHTFIKENFESSTLLEEHQVFNLHAFH